MKAKISSSKELTNLTLSLSNPFNILQYEKKSELNIDKGKFSTYQGDNKADKNSEKEANKALIKADPNTNCLNSQIDEDNYISINAFKRDVIDDLYNKHILSGADEKENYSINNNKNKDDNSSQKAKDLNNNNTTLESYNNDSKQQINALGKSENSRNKKYINIDDVLLNMNQNKRAEANILKQNYEGVRYPDNNIVNNVSENLHSMQDLIYDKKYDFYNESYTNKKPDDKISHSTNEEYNKYSKYINEMITKQKENISNTSDYNQKISVDLFAIKQEIYKKEDDGNSNKNSNDDNMRMNNNNNNNNNNYKNSRKAESDIVNTNDSLYETNPYKSNVKEPSMNEKLKSSVKEEKTDELENSLNILNITKSVNKSKISNSTDTNSASNHSKDFQISDSSDVSRLLKAPNFRNIADYKSSMNNNNSVKVISLYSNFQKDIKNSNNYNYNNNNQNINKSYNNNRNANSGQNREINDSNYSNVLVNKDKSYFQNYDKFKFIRKDSNLNSEIFIENPNSSLNYFVKKTISPFRILNDTDANVSQNMGNSYNKNQKENISNFQDYCDVKGNNKLSNSTAFNKTNHIVINTDAGDDVEIESSNIKSKSKTDVIKQLNQLKNSIKLNNKKIEENISHKSFDSVNSMKFTNDEYKRTIVESEKEIKLGQLKEYMSRNVNNNNNSITKKDESSCVIY